MNERNRTGDHDALREEPYLDTRRPEPRWAEDVFRAVPPPRVGPRPGDLVDSLPRRPKAVEPFGHDLGRAG